MPDFKPGDHVLHLVSREEGNIKSLHLCRIGTNVLEAAVVTVGKEEKIWLCYELDLILPPENSKPTHSQKPLEK